MRVYNFFTRVVIALILSNVIYPLFINTATSPNKPLVIVASLILSFLIGHLILLFSRRKENKAIEHEWEKIFSLNAHALLNTIYLFIFIIFLIKILAFLKIIPSSEIAQEVFAAGIVTFFFYFGSIFFRAQVLSAKVGVTGSVVPKDKVAIVVFRVMSFLMPIGVLAGIYLTLSLLFANL